MLTRIISSPLVSRVPRAFSPSFFSNESLHSVTTRNRASMARLTGKALMDDIANTIIEDSEPERAAEEAKKKEQRRKRRAAAKLERESKRTDKPAPAEVIVISDSEGNIARDSFPSTTAIEESVTEIGGTLTDANGSAVAPAQRMTSTTRGLPSSLSSGDELRSIRDASSLRITKPDSKQSNYEDNTPIILDACITTTAFPDSPAKKIDLSRFAFAQRPGPSIQNKLTHAKQDPTLAQDAPRIPKTATVDLPLADIFTTRQLTALPKCVVCDLAWTTRKTVPVKLQHMKRCATKNAWKEETVILAMTEVISNMPVSAAKERKNKGKEKATTEEAPKTYLEDLVNESAPKKKRRKGQGIEIVTVLNPNDAHAAILERAKAIFGRDTLPTSTESAAATADLGGFPLTQPFRPSRLGALGASEDGAGVLGRGMLEDEASSDFVAGKSTTEPYGLPRLRDDNLPPLTQAFRPSALGNRLAKRSVLFHESDDEVEMPPPTQAFRKSGLAERFGKAKSSLLDDENDDHFSENRAASPTSLHPVGNPARPCNPKTLTQFPPLTSLNAPRAPSPSCSESEEHLYLPTTAQTRLADLERRLAGIHASSGTVERRQSRTDPYTKQLSSFENIERARAQAKPDEAGMSLAVNTTQPARTSCTSRSRSSSSSRSRKARKPRRRKSRSPHKYQPTAEIANNGKYDNNNLDEDMRRVIIQDKELHMRVLRYEPIHFNVFLEAASQQGMGMGGKGFGLKLRAFLDRQTINFYGESALATNRRRYK